MDDESGGEKGVVTFYERSDDAKETSLLRGARVSQVGQWVHVHGLKRRQMVRANLHIGRKPLKNLGCPPEQRTAKATDSIRRR